MKQELGEIVVEYIETLEETLVIGKDIGQNQHSYENKIYENTEVTKLDKTKEIIHMYQLANEPKKCFLGHNLNDKVKKLRSIGIIEIVKKEFKDFMKFKEEHDIKL